MTRNNMIDIIVAYDVSTETPEGRRRLRNVAQICKNFGQRVQKSVFECRVTVLQLAQLKELLIKEMDPEEDSIRIYKLSSPREKSVESYGRDSYVDYDDPLIV